MFIDLKNIFMAINLFSILTGAISSEPYCVRNESIIIRTPVIKTRKIVIKPTGFWKAFKKTKTHNETYQDFEEHVKIKAVRSCCDGYKMSQFDICEPICANGCPKNGFCSKPENCQCKNGYEWTTEDGFHYCKPMCNAGCSANEHCAEPDKCECDRGYHRVDNHCVPRCKSGCPNGGKCIAPNECECAEGFNAKSGSCVPECSATNDCENSTDIDDEEWTTANASPLPSDSGEDDLDGEDENISSTPAIEDSESTTDSTECPEPHFFLHEGICQPICRYKPCVEHAVCQDNGTCACEDGFNWYKPAAVSDAAKVQAICLTQLEIDNFIQEERIAASDSEDEIDWIKGFYVLLGILSMVGALCFLIVMLLRRRREQDYEVEAKNNLYCTYDKNAKDMPLVL